MFKYAKLNRPFYFRG